MSNAAGPLRRIIPVILSGGSGKRLWPLSRAARPKQMIALAGPQSMLQMTAARVADADIFEPAMVVGSAGQAEATARQLEQAGTPAGVIIVEPAARNTAPAIALAALATDPEALLLIMPSDHLIGDPTCFVAAVQAAVPLAEQGWIVTFGVRPDRPETGYGYIRRGEEIGPGQFRAERFVEKPDAVTAATYLADGRHEWNAGIFLFSAVTYLAALATHAPDIEATARAAMEGAVRADERILPDAAIFSRTRAQSVDHAVMEHADRIAIVPVEMQWSDLGSWQALDGVSAKDAQGNALSGGVMVLDASDCLIRSEGPLVVAIGVEGLAIIATGDAILVVPKEQSQRVQEVVAMLAAKGDDRI